VCSNTESVARRGVGGSLEEVGNKGRSGWELGTGIAEVDTQTGMGEGARSSTRLVPEGKGKEKTVVRERKWKVTISNFAVDPIKRERSRAIPRGKGGERLVKGAIRWR